MRYPNLSRLSGSSLFFFVACLIIISVGLGDTWPQGMSFILICQTALIFVFILLFIAIKNNINIYFVLFYTFLIWGFVGALIFQNDIVSIIRDVGPMLFLIFPLASKYLARNWLAEIDARFFIYLVLLSALLLSVRFLFPYLSSYGLDISNIIASHFFPERNPNFHDPTLLFSCVFAIVYLLTNKTKYLFRFYLMILILLIFFIHFVAILRAPLIFYFLAIIAGLLFKPNPMRIFTLIVLILSYFFYDVDTLSIFNDIVSKFEDHGDNGKLNEYLVIYRFLETNSIWAILFGIGFGSEYYSEITLTTLRYTHTIFSFILLKFGFLGLFFFFAIYFYIIFNLFFYLFRTYRDKDSFSYSLCLATFSVFIVYTLTQPAFKSLSFSLLLFIFYFHKFKIRYLS